MKKKLTIFLTTLLIIILFLFIIIYSIKKGKFILNTTSSFPLGLYKITPKEHYQKRDLVSFCATPNPTIERMIKEGYTQPNPNCPNHTPQLLKKIVALEDDNVTIESSVKINNQPLKNSHLFRRDSRGNLLHIQPSQRIKRGFFWAMSDYNEKSYDSRYFGQIPLENIIGVATPIITWD